MSHKYIIFDLDGTLLGYNENWFSVGKKCTLGWIDKQVYGRVRPQTKKILKKAKEEFDNVYLWTLHGGNKPIHEQKKHVQQTLQTFQLESFFDQIIYHDLQYMGGDGYCKSLDKFVKSKQIKLHDIVIIQDAHHPTDYKSIDPQHRCIFIPTYIPHLLASSFDRKLKFAYETAKTMVGLK